ncbi:MAG: adenylyl-sulfate kinase, partial [Armatimonadetes bacterium]|nr:adenylyl-sulfate kinase [Armatimonadota bacterium]NIO75868.1 adenylyl-sulfate kinase [Armatimonadota bacterium]NIO98729.1 adenylyl-sulfate kinase [Armatimonadota bacterium]
MRGRLEHFIEVHIDCPLEECQRRDPKQIYKKAKEGIYTNVPGLQVPYEPPVNPEVKIDTTKGDIRQEAETVMA